jgi:hypothetical protein
VTVDGDSVVLHLAQPDSAIPLDLSQIMGMMVSPKAIADPSLLSTVPMAPGRMCLTNQEPC